MRLLLMAERGIDTMWRKVLMSKRSSKPQIRMLGSARIFASHYQFVICDDPDGFCEESNWTEHDVQQGFAGTERFRLIRTVDDSNDHWIEVAGSDTPPDPAPWQRMTCVSFVCATGKIHVMSVMDDEPRITLDFPNGEYSVFVAGCNIENNSIELEAGVEPSVMRAHMEWYRLFIVPGRPAFEGLLKD